MTKALVIHGDAGRVAAWTAALQSRTEIVWAGSTDRGRHERSIFVNGMRDFEFIAISIHVPRWEEYVNELRANTPMPPIVGVVETVGTGHGSKGKFDFCCAENDFVDKVFYLMDKFFEDLLREHYPRHFEALNELLEPSS